MTNMNQISSFTSSYLPRQYWFFNLNILVSFTKPRWNYLKSYIHSFLFVVETWERASAWVPTFSNGQQILASSCSSSPQALSHMCSTECIRCESINECQKKKKKRDYFPSKSWYRNVVEIMIPESLYELLDPNTWVQLNHKPLQPFLPYHIPLF